MTDLLGVVTTRHAYALFVLLSAIGLYMMIANKNLVKKVIGLNMFQTGVFLFFITSAYRIGGAAPIIEEGAGPYVSPLPQVIVLRRLSSASASQRSASRSPSGSTASTAPCVPTRSGR